MKTFALKNTTDNIFFLYNGQMSSIRCANLCGYEDFIIFI